MLLPVTISVLLIAVTKAADITKCEYDESICGCRTDNGYISLKKYEDKPFQATDTRFTYHWSPCKDMTVGGITSSCVQQGDTESETYDCGTHRSYSTSVKGGNAAFHMDAGDKQRHSMISCVCKPNGADVFSFVMEEPTSPGTYDLSLAGDSCCSKSGSGPGSSGGAGGLSIGSILLIAVLVVVIVYLLAGVVVQSAVRKAEGRERIPNVSFWSLLPGLVRDGFRFTFSCGKTTQYDQI